MRGQEEREIGEREEKVREREDNWQSGVGFLPVGKLHLAAAASAWVAQKAKHPPQKKPKAKQLRSTVVIVWEFIESWLLTGPCCA